MKIKRHDGSTRDLIRHLKAVHNITKQGVEPTTTNIQRPYAPRSREQAHITWKVARFIIVNKRPFHLVES